MTRPKEKKDILSLHQSRRNPSKEIAELQRIFPEGKVTGINSFIIKGDDENFQKIFEILPNEGPFILEKNPHWDQSRFEVAFSKRKAPSIAPVETEGSSADYVILWTAETEDSKALESQWRRQFQFEITPQGYLFHIEPKTFRGWAQDFLKKGSLTVHKTRNTAKDSEQISVLLINENIFEKPLDETPAKTPEEVPVTTPVEPVFTYNDLNVWMGFFLTKSSPQIIVADDGTESFMPQKIELKTFKNIEFLRGWNEIQADLRYFNFDKSLVLPETTIWDAGIGREFFSKDFKDRLGLVASGRIKNVKQDDISVVLMGIGLRYEGAFPESLNAFFKKIPFLSYEKHFLLRGDFFPGTLDSQVTIQNSYFVQFLIKMFFTPQLYGHMHVFTTSENLEDLGSQFRFHYGTTNFGFGAGYSF
jgi:hypothetical protein